MNIKAYSKRIAIGLYRLIIVRAWPVWLTPLVIYLALLTPYLFKYFGALFWSPEFHLRLAGFILQGLFVLIIACDIRALNKEFDRPNIFESIVQWGKDFYRIFFPKTIHAKIDIDSASGIVSASGNLSVGQAEKELEERVKILEERLGDYIEKTNEKIQTLRTDTNKIRKELYNEKQLREQDIQKVKSFMERISTRGLRLESNALVWLIIGLALSIFPNELAVILSYL